MTRRVRPEPAQRFRELPLGSDPPAASGLIPRDGNVHQSLEEVPLVLRRRAPGVLELFVRGEVLAGPDQPDASSKASTRRRR